MVSMQFGIDLALQRIVEALPSAVLLHTLFSNEVSVFRMARKKPVSTVVTVNFYLELSSFQNSFFFFPSEQ